MQLDCSSSSSQEDINVCSSIPLEQTTTTKGNSIRYVSSLCCFVYRNKNTNVARFILSSPMLLNSVPEAHLPVPATFAACIPMAAVTTPCTKYSFVVQAILAQAAKFAEKTKVDRPKVVSRPIGNTALPPQVMYVGTGSAFCAAALTKMNHCVENFFFHLINLSTIGGAPYTPIW